MNFPGCERAQTVELIVLIDHPNMFYIMNDCVHQLFCATLFVLLSDNQILIGVESN